MQFYENIYNVERTNEIKYIQIHKSVCYLTVPHQVTDMPCNRGVRDEWTHKLLSRLGGGEIVLEVQSVASRETTFTEFLALSSSSCID